MSYIHTIGERFDAETVILRLEQAGKTLLALPGKGCFPAQEGSSWPAVVHAAVEAYGYGEVEMRPPVPSAQAISQMDEAFRWIGLIPDSQRSHRRIVWMRLMVHPVRDHHLWSWRRIGRAFGWDHRAIQRWHAEAIDMIVDAAREQRLQALQY